MFLISMCRGDRLLVPIEFPGDIVIRSTKAQDIDNRSTTEAIETLADFIGAKSTGIGVQDQEQRNAGACCDNGSIVTLFQLRRKFRK
jgi:hypothetical protein